MASMTQISQELVQTMLSASFGCISYLRGIFPDDSFFEERFNASKHNGSKQQQSGADTGQRLMRLRRDFTPEATELLDYLENGVYEALNKKYLMSVILSISLDHKEHNHVHEAYTFQFSYSKDRWPSLLIKDSKRNRSTTALPLDAAKRSMQQLFRQLITMTQSLSPLPDDVNKILAIRLFFNDSAPDDYQPAGFRNALDRESARFVTRFENDRPHDQEIGSINTGFHACTLRITTISDLDDDESCHRVEAIKFWDAEHNAKHACQIEHPDKMYVRSPYDVPEPFDQSLSVASKNQTAQVHKPAAMVSDSQATELEPTQVLSQQCLQTQLAKSAPLETASVEPVHPKGCSLQGGRMTRATTAKLDNITVDVANLDLQRSKYPRDSRDSVDVEMQDTSVPDGLNWDQVGRTQPSDQDVVSCECGDVADEGVMVQCDRCEGWSHLPCYGYMETALEDGYVHVCFTCRSKRPEVLESFRSLAIMRRALHNLWSDGFVSCTTKDFGQSIGIKDLRTASGILHRLVNEGWITQRRKPSNTNRKGTGRSSIKTQPSHEVVRTAANEERLRMEYFDPKKELDQYLGPPDAESVQSDCRKASQKQTAKLRSKDSPSRATTFQKHSLLQSQTIPPPPDSTTGGVTQAQMTCEPSECSYELVKATPVGDASASAESQIKKRVRTSSGKDVNLKDFVTELDTTDDEADEDLTTARKQSQQAAPVPTRRESARIKRIKVSIVSKPIVACAY